MDTEVKVSSVAPPLCPDCGYNLLALTTKKPCPECGNVHDDDQMLVIWGYAYGQDANWGNLHCGIRTILLTLASIAFVGLAWVIAIVAMGHKIFIGMAMSKALGVGLIVLLVGCARGLWAKLQEQRGYPKPPYPVQARFTASGFARRNGFGTVSLKRWGDLKLKIDLREIGRCRMEGYRMEDDPRRWRERTRFGFEFEATPEQIEKVVTRIENWAIPHGVRIQRVL
jgi:hypothetical protein